MKSLRKALRFAKTGSTIWGERAETRGGELFALHDHIVARIVAGVAPQIWNFSVRDPVVAEQLHKAVGQQVRIHYQEHRGLPTTCFGETRHYVTRVLVSDEVPIATIEPNGHSTSPPARFGHSRSSRASATWAVTATPISSNKGEGRSTDSQSQKQGALV